MNIANVGLDDSVKIQRVTIYSVDQMNSFSTSLGVVMKEGNLFVKRSILPFPDHGTMYVAGLELYPSDPTIYTVTVENDDAEDCFVELVKSEFDENGLDMLIHRL